MTFDLDVWPYHSISTHFTGFPLSRLTTKSNFYLYVQFQTERKQHFFFLFLYHHFELRDRKRNHRSLLNWLFSSMWVGGETASERVNTNIEYEVSEVKPKRVPSNGKANICFFFLVSKNKNQTSFFFLLNLVKTFMFNVLFVSHLQYPMECWFYGEIWSNQSYKPKLRIHFIKMLPRNDTLFVGRCRNSCANI